MFRVEPVERICRGDPKGTPNGRESVAGDPLLPDIIDAKCMPFIVHLLSLHGYDAASSSSDTSLPEGDIFDILINHLCIGRTRQVEEATMGPVDGVGGGGGKGHAFVYEAMEPVEFILASNESLTPAQISTRGSTANGWKRPAAQVCNALGQLAGKEVLFCGARLEQVINGWPSVAEIVIETGQESTALDQLMGTGIGGGKRLFEKSFVASVPQIMAHEGRHERARLDNSVKGTLNAFDRRIALKEREEAIHRHGAFGAAAEDEQVAGGAGSTQPNPASDMKTSSTVDDPSKPEYMACLEADDESSELEEDDPSLGPPRGDADDEEECLVELMESMTMGTQAGIRRTRAMICARAPLVTCPEDVMAITTRIPAGRTSEDAIRYEGDAMDGSVDGESGRTPVFMEKELRKPRHPWDARHWRIWGNHTGTTATAAGAVELGFKFNQMIYYDLKARLSSSTGPGSVDNGLGSRLGPQNAIQWLAVHPEHALLPYAVMAAGQCARQMSSMGTHDPSRMAVVSLTRPADSPSLVRSTTGHQGSKMEEDDNDHASQHRGSGGDSSVKRICYIVSVNVWAMAGRIFDETIRPYLILGSSPHQVQVTTRCLVDNRDAAVAQLSKNPAWATEQRLAWLITLYGYALPAGASHVTIPVVHERCLGEVSHAKLGPEKGSKRSAASSSDPDSNESASVTGSGVPSTRRILRAKRTRPTAKGNA